MATQGFYTIAQNENIAKDVYKMRLLGDTSALKNPGQFINIKVDGFYLRRPISVCSYQNGHINIIYKVVGKGTKKMSTLKVNDVLDVLVGLGNGFDITPALGKKILILGGGVGVPPLYGLAKALKGQNVTCILGFQSKEDVFYEEKFSNLVCKTHVTTVDGSYGTKGFVTTLQQNVEYDYYFTCGPMAMLQAVHQTATLQGIKGQLSFEERMGCGFGACMGCSCQTIAGSKRICVEGPIMLSEEVIL